MTAEDQLAVWMHGERAGVLTRGGAGMTLQYDPRYMDNVGAALSVSLPKRSAFHDSEQTSPWFDNLLPDNDEVRARWAAMFGDRRVSVFSLLTHMGADCAGAVQVLPIGELPDTAAGSRLIDDAEIERMLRALRRDDANWNLGATGGRWSLGGAQGKFALSRSADGTWCAPTGRAPSSHIFKIGPAVGEYGVIAEHVTSRMAGLLGIPVARSELCRFGDQLAVISERFDRRVDAGGTIRRLHQEDLCQAMGISRALKYQSDGGPSVSEIAQLFREHVDPRDLKPARELFATALVFNWLVAGTDAHAKNFALLHFGARVRLAPLYDLTSAALTFDPDELHYRGKLAMKLGGEYRLRQIRAKHLGAAALEIGVDPDWILALAARFTDRLQAVFDQAMGEIRGIAGEAELSFRRRLSTRIEHARASLADRRGVTPAAVSADGPRVWVAPHARDGRLVAGYWRRSPGAR